MVRVGFTPIMSCILFMTTVTSRDTICWRLRKRITYILHLYIPSDTSRARLSRGHVQPAEISDQRPRALPSFGKRTCVSLLVYNTHGISVVCNCIVRDVCDKSSYVQCLCEYVIHHLLYAVLQNRERKKCMDHSSHQLKDQASPRVLLRL